MKKEEDKKENEKNPILSGDVKKSITAVVLITLAIIFLLSLIGKAGIIGQNIDKFLALFLGWGRFGLPPLLLTVGVVYFRKVDTIRYYLTTIGSLILLFFGVVLVHLFFDLERMFVVAKEGEGGGYLGLSGAYFLAKYLGKGASFVVSSSGILIGFILTFNFPLNKSVAWLSEGFFWLKDFSSRMIGKINSKKEEKDEDVADDVTENNIRLKTIEFLDDKAFSEKANKGESKIADEISIEERKSLLSSKKENRQERKNGWIFPPLGILEASSRRITPKNLEEKAEIIKKTLAEFGIEVELGGHNFGPTIVQYSFKPSVGVRLSKIVSLQGNIALNLEASNVRIEAPIPGKSLVGIEVPLPESERALVGMRTMMENPIFKSQPKGLSLIIGEDVNGDIVVSHLEKMPHLLIAGSTNAGKSVCINSILLSLLYRNSPDDLRMILVDPKRVELSLYDGIPHLICPVITDNSKVVDALKFATREMEDRYGLLQKAGARDIFSFNQKAQKGERMKVYDEDDGAEKMEKIKKMPFIVVVIDELADLMAMYGREVEGAIIRLAQMARAVGIHLIVSTQRPSVNVLTGVIKANITTRIAFQVATQIDSRTILDMAGAEKLLGNGDMLFASASFPKPKRIQGVFVSEKEVKEAVREIKRNTKESRYEKNSSLDEKMDDMLSEKNIFGNGKAGLSGDRDEALFEMAKREIITSGKASTTYIQRKLNIGYPKAANLMEELEAQGVVGPLVGSKREILLKDAVEYENPEKDQEKRENWGQ